MIDAETWRSIGDLIAKIGQTTTFYANRTDGCALDTVKMAMGGTTRAQVDRKGRGTAQGDEMPASGEKNGVSE